MNFEAMTLDGASNSDDSTEDDKIRFVSRNNSLKNSQVNILTGIMLEIWPYVLALSLMGVLVVARLVRKKKQKS